MRNRNLAWAIVVGILLSAARPAAAQEPRASLLTPAPQTGFTLTNQPLFGEEAQNQPTSRDPEVGFGFGIKGGPLFTTFNQQNVSFENKTGFLVGIWFGGNRTGTVGVEGEVMYGKKGTGSVDLYFLEIPVLLRVNVGSQSINKWVVYGIGGPAFDIKLKARQGDLDVASNYAGLNIGIIGGAGFEIFRFLIEARGNWGIRNVVGGDLANAIEIKDKSFALLFGVRLN